MNAALSIAIFFLVFGLERLEAQNCAVRLWSAEPTNAIEVVRGVPGDWPAAIKDIGSSTNLPGPGWQLMSKPALEAHTNSLAAAFATWKASYVAWQESERATEHAAKEGELRDLENELRTVLGNLRAADASWGSLAPAQKDAAQRQSIRAALLMHQLQAGGHALRE